MTFKKFFQQIHLVQSPNAGLDRSTNMRYYKNQVFLQRYHYHNQNKTRKILHIIFGTFHGGFFEILCRYQKFHKQSLEGVLLKKVFLEISQNSKENICVRVFFLITLQTKASNFIEKETLAQAFSCKFCKFFKNTFFLKVF